MNEELKTMHLFAGAGGGILADLILGHRPIVAVEWDKYACEVLRARVSDGWFDGMSVWEGDVRLFDPSEYKGRVDCIHAGFPCTDISQAGDQAGVGEDTRSGLYREVLRIADILQPRYLFLENVAAIVTGDDGSMLRTVVGDVAKRGYDAVWNCLPAAEVGANHKRDRWWLLAYPNGIGHRGWGSQRCSSREQQLLQDQQQRCQVWSETKGCSELSAHEDVAYSASERVQRQWRCGQQVTQAHDREELSLRGSERRRTSWWEIEPAVGRVVDGMADRSHRIKALGNGQVPLQCATAFKILWEEHNAIKTASRKGGSDVKGITS